MAVMGVFAITTAAYAEDAIKTDKVDVISTTPLSSLGLPLEKVPYSVQVIKGSEMQKQNSLSIADFMSQNLNGVSVNDTQNNPYQPDVSFRGFTASPLLGTPQGLSVFVDGVRVNEPFGDVVNWDLIPVNAIQSINLIPGSNPLFGLNTLGGALSVQTKSGRTNQGGAVEAYTGSWGRKAASAEYGGVSKDGSVDYFFSANSFREDGWRDYSPTDVRQLFGKVGWQNETTKIDLSYTGADNDMIGNGLTPTDMLRTLGRKTILTRPDQTKNTMSFINLNGSHWFSDDVLYSANLYFRGAKTKTLNGDGNDDQEIQDAIANGDATDVNDALAQCAAGSSDSDELCNGAINRTKSKRISMGFTNQLTFNQDLLGKKNQFTGGFGYDYGRTKFRQSSEYGLLDASRGIVGNGVANDLDEQVRLRGVSKTWSLFATDTLSLSQLWHLTLSARYNHTRVENRDGFDNQLDANGDPVYSDPANQTLTANHNFNRLNPAIGFNFTPSPDLTVYGAYNEGSRAPTAIELGCANPAQPCKLPNAFAGDPPLKQVVAKTYEAGLRGNVVPGVRWSFSTYRTQNTDDIQFITTAGTTNGAGFFDNVGKTRRQGLDAALNGIIGRFGWAVGYSLVDATYQSEFDIANEVNSSSDGDKITVKKGDRIPGIPKHQFKLRTTFAITPSWTVGSNIIAFSDQYARGNENNEHDGPGAKVGGYAVVNLDTRYIIGKGWQVFAKANNVFDREYNNGGLLGESLFTANGQFNNGNESNAFLVAPGAPRAGWVGVRYEFGGKTNVADSN